MTNTPYSKADTATIYPYYISRLILTNFRNYAYQRFDITSEPVVITGANGAGKTNILEAISFLAPGKGLRSSKLENVDRLHQLQSYAWAVSSHVVKQDTLTNIGTGRNEDNNKRIVKIDGNKIKGQAALANHVSVLWLTPQMDNLFVEGTTERRRFLDRLVTAFDGEHAKRLYRYEHYVRERMRLLQQQLFDDHWLNAIEQNIAENAIAIAAARNMLIDRLSQSMGDTQSCFPQAIIAVDGTIETALRHQPALEVEANFTSQLQANRNHDHQSGRTTAGTHRSDFSVIHASKQLKAELCSTGEQKALLIAIILAEARARAVWHHNVPILLFDEIAAHLDQYRMDALIEELSSLNAQTWMTGTEPHNFQKLQSKAQFFEVTSGEVESCNFSLKNAL